MSGSDASRPLGTMPIDEFLDLLASPSPTPGGGGIAALAGATAAGLVSMVCHLTLGREKYASVQGEVKELLSKAEGLRDRLHQAIDGDSQAYSAVMDAYKLPKATEEEKRARSARIQETTLEASRVPLEIARNSVLVLELALPAARITNVQAVGDAIMAGYLAESAARGLIANIEINLRGVKDREAAGRLNAEGQALLEGIGEKLAAVVRAGMSRL